MTRGRWTLLAFTASLAVACGDAETTDTRGYTKAPLEEPGWFVESEEATRMSELGDPIRIPMMRDAQAAEEEEVPQPAAGPDATATDTAATADTAAADTAAAD